jgi:hypothetical protein
MNTKKIAWESWNSKIEEHEDDGILDIVDDNDEYQEESEQQYVGINPEALFSIGKMVHTPMGEYPSDSLLRPSQRWDCWIGHTNFEITKDIANKIEEIEGIEALKILGRYSFFVGVARMFDIKDVRRDVDANVCNYTEEEILSDSELQETVDLVKKQLQSVDYWSILVGPRGEVEYVSSNKMDKTYLDGLNELIVLKNKIGGIILRGTNG